MYAKWFIIAATTFALTVVNGYILIPCLKSHKMGEMINENGPYWHKFKKTTPIMGGICFITAMISVACIVLVWESIHSFQNEKWIPFLATLFLAVWNGIVGFVDDYLKLFKHQNEGLTRWQKLFYQLIIAGTYVFFMAKSNCLDSTLLIPFLNIQLQLHFLFYPFAILLIAGIVNSVNITDGIDGLASTIAVIISMFLLILSFLTQNNQLGICSALLMGGTIGFLVFNHNPATTFMGDTGSLFLGGFLSGLCFMMNQPLLLLVLSMVYIFEMFTSLLQILYRKITGKNLFLIAPFHHRLEMFKWSEKKIVTVFSLISLVFGMAVLLEYCL